MINIKFVNSVIKKINIVVTLWKGKKKSSSNLVTFLNTGFGTMSFQKHFPRESLLWYFFQLLPFLPQSFQAELQQQSLSTYLNRSGTASQWHSTITCRWPRVLKGKLAVTAISKAGSTYASPGNEPVCGCTVKTAKGWFSHYKPSPFFHQRSLAILYTPQTMELGRFTALH